MVPNLFILVFVVVAPQTFIRQDRRQSHLTTERSTIETLLEPVENNEQRSPVVLSMGSTVHF